MSDQQDQGASPEETELLLSMSTSLPAAGQYLPMDRYRDFVKVFKGTEEGQRVLREILSWGHMFRPSFVGSGQIDPFRLAIAEGERNMALRLLTTVSKEPVQRPMRANSKPTEE